MKRLALFAAVVLAVAACAKSDAKPADSTPAAMAPAPAVSDSAKMADSMKMKAVTDSTHKADSVKAAAALKTPAKPTKSKTKKP